MKLTLFLRLLLLLQLLQLYISLGFSVTFREQSSTAFITSPTYTANAITTATTATTSTTVTLTNNADCSIILQCI